MTDWITTMATCVSAIATSVTAVAIIIIWWQFKADHERSRREGAIAMMSMWAIRISEMPSGSRFTLSILKKLNEGQCASLSIQEPFAIDAKCEYLVAGVLQDQPNKQPLNKENDMILLDQHQVSIIRSFAIAYLNLLEVIFGAWRHNTADRDIICDEFGPIVTPQKDHFPLDKFRIATGRYPSIAAFTAYMKKEYSRESGKSRVA